MIEGSLNSKLKFVVCLGLGSSHMHDVLVLCVSARVRLLGRGIDEELVPYDFLLRHKPARCIFQRASILP